MARLVVRGVRVPGPTGNRLGWWVGRAIESIEGTDYAHVFPVLERRDGLFGWNVGGFLDRWRSVPTVALLERYGAPSVVWVVELDDEAAAALKRWWDGYIGRRYAVGRLILLPLWRATGWDWVRRLAGITCTGVLASGLARIGLWRSTIPTEMAGLVDVAAALDHAGVRIRG